MAKKERITVLLDPDESRDLIKQLKEKGQTPEGQRLMKVGQIMDKAGLTEHLLLMQRQGIEEKAGALGMVKMAINITDMIINHAAGDTEIKPSVQVKDKPKAKPKKPAGIFSAGDNPD